MAISYRSGRMDGKAPKLRFKPGWFVRQGTQTFKILYAYRLTSTPHEWVFALEYRDNLTPPDNELSHYCEGQSFTPGLIKHEPFRSSTDAMMYWGNIYAHGDRKHVTNKDLLNNYTVVSGGEICLK